MKSVNHAASTGWGSHVISQNLKPIFHCDAKYLASGVGFGQCPRRQHFALGIPTCWYLKCENLRHPTPNLKFALAPMPNPVASQWNIGGVGSSSIGHVHFMYISCCLCNFFRVANVKISGRKSRFQWNTGLSYRLPRM